MRFTIVALSILSSASANVLSLTSQNIDSVNDKTVFIKFFAPWCGHCKSMAADWEKLARIMSVNADLVIAEADCTSANIGSLCEDNGIKGFPTLKYGNIMSLSDYDGARTYSELVEFATENLKPACSPSDLDLCDDAEKATIQKYLEMSPELISKMIADVDSLIAVEDKKLSDAVEKLSATYDDMMEEFENGQNLKKEETDYKLLKAIFGLKKPKAVVGDDDDDDDDGDYDDDDDDDEYPAGDDDDDDDA